MDKEIELQIKWIKISDFLKKIYSLLFLKGPSQEFK